MLVDAGQVHNLSLWATMPEASAKDEKPASAKKYDNDNLPTTDKISIVGNVRTPLG